MRTEWDTTAGSIALGTFALAGLGAGAYVAGSRLGAPAPLPTLLAGFVGVSGFVAVSYLYFLLLIEERPAAGA